MKTSALKEIYSKSLLSSFMDKVSKFAESSLIFKKREYFKGKNIELPEVLKGSGLFRSLDTFIQNIRPKKDIKFFEKVSLFLFFLIFIFTPLKGWLKIAYPSQIYTFIAPVILVVIAIFLFFRKRNDEARETQITVVDLGISLIIFSLVVSAIASFLAYGQVKNIFFEGFIRLSYFAIFYIGRLVFSTKKALKLFITFNLAIVFILSVVGIGQYIFGVATPQWIEGYEAIRTRAFSTLDNPIILSGYIDIFFFIALGLFFGLKRLRDKALMMPLFLVMITALVLTFSRSSWIGLIVGLLFFFFVYNPKYILRLIPVSIILLLIIPSGYFYRFLAIFDSRYDDISAVSGRVWTLNNIAHILPNHLLFGVGPGMYGGEVAFKTSPSIVYMEGIQGGAVPMQNTDNQFLQVLIQQGLVGILVFIFFVLASLYTGLVIYQKLEDKFLKMLALGITTAILSFFVQGIFTDVFQFPQMSLVMLGFLGILVSLPKLQKILKHNLYM